MKPVKSAIAYMPNVKYELPYDGAKEMLLVDDVCLQLKLKTSISHIMVM